MLFTDTYNMPTAMGEGSYKDRGSKFMAYAFPVQHEDEVKQVIHDLKREHFAAAHHCYAYVLGVNQEVQKANDDREPANTAGRPILRSILARELTNTLIVVIRYFGGKLLGVPGLIQAYGEAASDALNNATVVQKIVYEQHEISFDHVHENEAFRIIKQFGLKITQHHHAEKITLIFDVRKSMAEQVIKAIREKRLFEVKYIGQH